MDAAAPAEQFAAPSFFVRLSTTVSRRYQKLLDDSVPHRVLRWALFGACVVGFMLRVYLLQGWFIIAYALGIYLLNLLIAFLSPRIDPALAEMDNEDEDGNVLPSRASDEHRPFIRRLPEFKFWLQSQQATVASIGATFFEAFNVPVFWPILVFYFVLLFVLSMKKQIRHMIKYKYIPFTFGKQTYKGKEDTGKVIKQ